MTLLTGPNKHQDESYEKDPLEWYVQPRACVEQLANFLDFGNDLIWDPAVGSGGILDVFKDRGHEVIGSDVVDRHTPGGHRFYVGNFLQVSKWPSPPLGKRLSIVCNPPFSRAAEFMHRAVYMMPIHRAAFLVPLDFLCAQSRYRFFTSSTPSHTLFCSERPSMPPGGLVSALGDKAFKGGKSNFVWVCFCAPHKWKTQAAWLRPTGY